MTCPCAALLDATGVSLLDQLDLYRFTTPEAAKHPPIVGFIRMVKVPTLWANDMDHVDPRFIV
jgi:hypothetical protein